MTEGVKQPMSRVVVRGGVLAALVLPAAAYGGDDPTSADRANAAQECPYERGGAAATREAFAAKYRTFGKCVSQAAKAHEDKADASDRGAADARINAAKRCASERGTTVASRKAFADKYATNASKSNAFGKCVSEKARESS
jgi:hypothetical protein